MLRKMIVLMIPGLFCTQVAAQSNPDRDAIMEPIEALFEGLRKQDTAMMRRVAEPGTRLVVTRTVNGSPQYLVIPYDSLLAVIARSTQSVNEEIANPRVVQHDNLATVWVDYDFYVDGRVDHCGEDSFQLARGPQGWRIIAIADTQRRDC